MTRYNLFHRIHKGLRALLFDTSILLQRTDFILEEEARETITRLRLVIALFEKYQYWEDKYVLPAMNAYEPAIAIDFEQDHEEAYLAGNKVELLLKDFFSASLPLEKLSIGSGIVTQVEAFTVSTLLYLGREEQLINKMLWRYYTDAELERIAWKFIGDLEPSLMSPYNKWMIRGLNNNEIVRWIKEVKQIADKEGYHSLLKTAEAELNPHRWGLLEEVLLTGELVAGRILL